MTTTPARDDDGQNEAAAERVRERSGERAANLRVLSEPFGIAKADSPARIAKRMDRLASYHLGEAMPVGRADGLAGFNPLISAEGKVIVGERVTIIQHPAGEMKQIVLRDQQVVDVPDSPFLYYLADTERGSSGSPVFNDQWEIVALHHASVPRPGPDGAEPGAPQYVNEGVRVSRTLKSVDDAQLPGEQRAMLTEIDVRQARPTPPPPFPHDPPPKEPDMPEPVPPSPAPTADGDGWVQITVPLEIRLRLGAPAATAAQVTVVAPAAAPPAPPRRHPLPPPAMRKPSSSIRTGRRAKGSTRASSARVSRSRCRSCRRRSCRSRPSTRPARKRRRTSCATTTTASS